MSVSEPSVESGVLEAGTLVLEKYKIERLVGEGGMGSVYEATNTFTGKRVALKRMRTDSGRDQGGRQKRLLREARISARVQHPNTVDIYDVGVEGASIYLVMELLRGRALDAWLEAHPKPSPEALLAIFVPALHGLHAIHTAGIVHRDLKPQNIFVCEDAQGNVLTTKVLDFGIALELNSDSATLTAPGTMIGTPAYMAPEQFEGGEVDPRTDIYSSGVILYEALAGQPPFQVDTLARLLRAVLDETPAPIAQHRPDLPQDLCDIVMRAMSRTKTDRFDDVPALVKALDPHHAHSPLLVSRASLRPVAQRSRRTLWIALAAVAVTLAIGATAMHFLFPRGEAETHPVASPTPAPPRPREEPPREVAVPGQPPEVAAPPPPVALQEPPAAVEETTDQPPAPDPAPHVRHEPHHRPTGTSVPGVSLDRGQF